MLPTFKKLLKRKKNYPAKEIKDCSLPLSDNLEKNVAILKKILANGEDVVFRDFYFGGNEKLKGTIVYIDNIVLTQGLNDNILSPLMFQFAVDGLKPDDLTKEVLKVISKNSVSAGQIKETKVIEEIVNDIFSGSVLILGNFLNNAIIVNIPSWKLRGITEPGNERVVRGPREGFVEDMAVNISLLRKRIKDVNLVIERQYLGEKYPTLITIVYLKDIADPKIVEMLKERLVKIKKDNINLSGEIEQLIEDDKYSFFPQIQPTERVDKAVANITEGRIVVVVDGTPFVLMLPATLIQFFQTSDDYAERFWLASFIRILRFFCLFTAVVLPALYIALISYNAEMIPYSLALSIATSRAGVPFPPFLEALFLSLTLEILQEASLRLPSSIGQTIGIVGGLVLGQAVVEAKFAAPVMVIVIALTAISSFVIPSYGFTSSLRLMRIVLMICASALGVFGLIVGMLFFFTKLVALESFGMPYLSPLAPFHFRYLKDSILRAPTKDLKKKNDFLHLPRQKKGKSDEKK